VINPPTKQRSDEENEEGETEVAIDGKEGPRTNDVGIFCDEPSTHSPATVVGSSILHNVRPGCSVDDPLFPKVNALENTSIAPSTKKEGSGDIITITSDDDEEVTKKKKENKLLLVYPFDVGEAVLSGSASALTELGGDSLGLEAEPAAQVDHPSDNQKRPSRTHYVTICEDDKGRLQPGQFLNDTLVDFWMRW
jgi:hypothetical protein